MKKILLTLSITLTIIGTFLFGGDVATVDISNPWYQSWESPTEEQIECVLSQQTSIEELHLNYLFFVTKDENLFERLLSGNFQSLKKLTLDGSNIRSFNIPITFAPQLEVLHFRGGNNQTDGILLSGLENLPSLKVLDIRGTHVSWKISGVLNDITLPSLEELYHDPLILGDEVFFSTLAPNLRVLHGNPGLKDISSGDWKHLHTLHCVGSQEIVEKLGALPSLRELALAPNSTVIDFSSLTQLETLIVGKGYLFDLHTLEGLSSLQSLSLDNLTPENTELTAYISLPSLRSLSLGNCRGAKLANFAPNLTRLFLASSNITGSDAAEIAKIENLESLDVGHTSLTGAAVAKFGKLASLKQLTLAGTDMSKADFSKLTLSLEELDLSGCKLTISSFNTLYAMTHLKKLNLQGIQNNNINPTMKDALQDALPLCEILY